MNKIDFRDVEFFMRIQVLMKQKENVNFRSNKKQIKMFSSLNRHLKNILARLSDI